jgi:outer membrane protein OmpA-like peptidoglycan-associated protein
MNQYPDMIVSIESHTDSRGDATYNEYLSLNRAKETKAYMVKHGISEDRIVGVKGLGESQLTNHCDNTVKCTEEEHQMNRRTMFAIINPDSYKKANK